MVNLLGKNFLMGWILVFFVILFVFVAFGGYSDLQQNKNIYEANILDSIDQRLFSIFFEVNSFPSSFKNDVLFLSKSSILERFVNDEKNQANLESLRIYFFDFARSNPAYSQVRYIDEEGDEIIRIDFDGVEHTVVQEDKLQNKIDRYYFDETLNVGAGNIFISKLDLNVENKKIEVKKIGDDSFFVPMIRYSTPIFDRTGKFRGIVILNVYADYFLESVRSAQREGEEVVLIDNEGYYLAHPNRSKEYGFMFGDASENFYEDYPNISKEVLLDPRKRGLEFGDLIFSFRQIYPISSSFESFRKTSQANNFSEEYSWVLVSVSNREIISQIFKDFEEKYFYSLFFLVFMVLAIITLIFFLGFKVSPKRRNL